MELSGLKILYKLVKRVQNKRSVKFREIGYDLVEKCILILFGGLYSINKTLFRTYIFSTVTALSFMANSHVSSIPLIADGGRPRSCVLVYSAVPG